MSNSNFNPALISIANKDFQTLSFQHQINWNLLSVRGKIDLLALCAEDPHLAYSVVGDEAFEIAHTIKPQQLVEAFIQFPEDVTPTGLDWYIDIQAEPSLLDIFLLNNWVTTANQKLSIELCTLCEVISFFKPYILSVLEILLLIVPLLVAIAYTTLLERKVMAGVQRRSGPNLVGFYGLLQPLADGLKLALKETVFPSNANLLIFLFSPILTFFLSLVTWVVVPFDTSAVLVDLNVGVLYLLAVSSLSVYGIIMAGWSSNSKYAFLGSLRSAAQLISYEISISMIILTVLVCVGSLNLSDIVLAQESVWFVLPLFPSFVMFMISGLAETNRAPFDLPEAEAELVSGYSVEYSSMAFTLFFLGEYAHMILMGSMASVFFLGGWLPPIDIFPLNLIPGTVWFGFKVMLVLFFMVWVRAAFPRYRYDQLMTIGWKTFLPLSFGWFVFVVGCVYCINESLFFTEFDIFPNNNLDFGDTTALVETRFGTRKCVFDDEII